MTLAHPDIKNLIDSWQSQLRSMTGDKTISLFATSLQGKKMEVEELVSIVCGVTGFSADELRSKSRKRERVVARQLICYYAYNMRLATLNNIGLNLGGRDHTTVIHSKETIQNLIDTKDASIVQLIGKIENEISNHERKPSQTNSY